MRTGFFLVVLMICLTFVGFTQERKDSGRERDPAATTSTRSKPTTRQDAADTPRAKPREAEKRKAPSSRPARTKPSIESSTETSKAARKAANDSPEPSGETNDNLQPSREANSWDAGQVQEKQTGRIARGEDHQKVFENVRSGLNSGNIASFSELLGPQVHVNLRGGESGYFSSSQAYYVLENYLRANRFSGLRFGTMEQSGDTPFATGKADLDQKGMKEAAQVYVSLTQVGGRWVISQIKIY